MSGTRCSVCGSNIKSGQMMIYHCGCSFCSDECHIQYCQSKGVATGNLTGISKAADVGTAKHFDEGKPALQWIPYEPLTEVAKVFEYGAVKYGQHNYKGGMKWSKMVGSILRHTYRFMNGEDKDDESGLPHLAHAACCCLMLLYFYKYHPDLDDRSTG